MRPPLLPRALAAAVAVAGSIVLVGEPAGAHATFAEVGVPADSEQRITMFVPEERGPTVHNVGVDLRVPAGWSALGCQQVAPWNCQVADGGVIKWAKAAGAAPSDADTMFVFTVRTGSPGTASVPVVQTYDSGEVVRWIGPADSEEPAAFIEVLPQGAPVPPTTALTTTTSTAAPAGTTTRPAATAAPTTTTTAAPTTTTTAAATTTTTGPPDTATSTTSSVPETSTTATSAPDEREVRTAAADTHDDGGGSAALVVLAAVVAIAGVAAGWAAWRRRRQGVADPPA